MKRIAWCMAIMGLAATPAFAASQVKSGNTTLVLDDDVATLLADCDVQTLKPGSQLRKEQRIWLRAISGAVGNDSGGALRAEINHLGGLSISCPGYGSVTLSNLRLDAIDGPPVFTAIAAVDNTLLGRLPFAVPSPAVDIARIDTPNGTVLLRREPLSLTAEGATLFNELVPVFGPGSVLGEATTRVKFRAQDRDDGRDDDDNDAGGPGDSVNPSQLPAAIQRFIASNYPGLGIAQVEVEDDDDEPYRYEVTLSDGTELYFAANGSLVAEDAADDDDTGSSDDSSIPSAQLPAAITVFIAANYPGQSVVRVDVEDDDDEPYKYEVTLGNGTELYFDAGGQFLFAEDD